jgi:hypothetical protein
MTIEDNSQASHLVAPGTNNERVLAAPDFLKPIQLKQSLFLGRRFVDRL